MTKNKTNYLEREQRVSLKFFLFLMAFVLVIGLLVGGYSTHASSEIMGLYAVVGSICCVLWIYFCREDISVWAMFTFLLLGGIYIGLFLNISLSTEFLSEPSFVFLVVNLFTTCILLWSSFTLCKDTSWSKKLAFVFLDAGLLHSFWLL